ncbi:MULTISPECIES: HU family DNA-binding protein [Lactonifactor]|uniref:HU family DNA-binding protein n=1 Tax=Lactonifactor TaxID=420345 RepID=UPI0012B08250|nr:MULTISPECIES: HU family DNA-binding protein [Lactonifactor]MCB5714511.1 HU family DNA-binding protein [Lactonifactor longoviformis]MCB5718465.1 HU family DNA-binding protein [Lactonifactor longoviformis]
MDNLLEVCSRKTGCGREQTEQIIALFLSEIVEELARGHKVDLGTEFGVFSVKLRTGAVAEGSPRTPKDSRYKVVFRENSGMKQRLKIQLPKEK